MEKNAWLSIVKVCDAGTLRMTGIQLCVLEPAVTAKKNRKFEASRVTWHRHISRGPMEIRNRTPIQENGILRHRIR